MRLLIDATTVLLNTGVLHLVTNEADSKRIAGEGRRGLRVEHEALVRLLDLVREHEVQVHVPVSRLQDGVSAYLRGAGVPVAWQTWHELRGGWADVAVVAQRGLDPSADHVPALRLHTWEVHS
jgi:hypothetical protein